MQSTSSPSTSPTRIRALMSAGAIDVDHPNYKSAMDKLYEASWKFNRNLDETTLKSLDNRRLYPEEFKNIIRSGMNCKLTPEELEAIQPIFDNEGYIDGSQFILLFFKMRFEYRRKTLTERIIFNKKAYQHHKELEQSLLQPPPTLQLVDDFDENDFHTAEKKLIDAAVKFDRTHPGAPPLNSFDVALLAPYQFRENLKTLFHVKLTPRELAAFMRNFHTLYPVENGLGIDNSALTENIHCSTFLVYFFRKGFEEKARRLKSYWKKEKAKQQEREKRKEAERKELEQKITLSVDMKFSEEEKQQVLRRLRHAAKLYDKTTPGARSLQAFEIKEMEPNVFREQLRMILNIQTTPSEVGALVTVYDTNNSGKVNCEEFVKSLLKMGFEERERDARAERKAQQDLEAQREAKRQQDLAYLANKAALKVSYDYTESDFTSAMFKLTEAAWRYDKYMPAAPSLEAFEKKTMEPHILKEQLKRAFAMKVTPPELGAIMHYFDPEKKGYIICEQFLKKFFRTGYEERMKQKQQYREYEQQRHQRVILAKEKKLFEQEIKLNKSFYGSSVIVNPTNSQVVESTESLASSVTNSNTSQVKEQPPAMASTSAVIVFDKTFTPEDFTNAFNKLTSAAMKYDKALPGAVGLNAFECMTMPANVFKEQLKLAFNIKVSMPELWALVSYFEHAPDSGELDCKRFLHQFLATGHSERERLVRDWRIHQQRKEQSITLKQQQKEEQVEKLAYAEVDFDFNEEEFDEALYKIISLGHRLDKRQLGAAGLSAFECESLNPSEFKELLKRTFGLKVSARELGAIVSYFDVNFKKRILNTFFLNTMMQVRIQCEEMKNKPDEQRLLQTYHEQLKAMYQLRTMKNPSMDAKPWRSNSVLAVARLTGRIYKPKSLDNSRTAPTDPKAKYQLRMYIAKKTKRVDLTCKKCWFASTHGSKVGTATATPTARSSTNSPRRDTNSFDEGADDQDNDENALDMTNIVIDNSLFSEVDDSSNVQIVGSKVNKPAKSNISTRNNSISASQGAASTDNSVSEVEMPKQLTASVEFRLQRFPLEIFNIYELRELWLDNHKLSFLPEQVSQLTHLQVLSISNNVIEELPFQIGNLINLQKFYFRGNNISVLPNAMSKLTQLIDLNGANNLFDEFPEVLTTLTKLQVLDLSENKISKLPKTLRYLHKLTFLNLEGNTFRMPTAAASTNNASSMKITVDVSNNSVNNPLYILGKMSWLEVKLTTEDSKGTGNSKSSSTSASSALLPATDQAAKLFMISPAEEFEYLSLIKSRAAKRATENKTFKRIRK